MCVDLTVSANKPIPTPYSSEQVLLQALTAEQIMAVAEWLGIETSLRTQEGYSQQVKEALDSMANRLRDLAPQSQQPSLTGRPGPKGYVVSYLEFL